MCALRGVHEQARVHELSGHEASTRPAGRLEYAAVRRPQAICKQVSLMCWIPAQLGVSCR